jgi:hypothetical protein
MFFEVLAQREYHLLAAVTLMTLELALVPELL